MKPELFHKIIDEVARESPDTRLWLAIMGEPLMDKDIVSHLRYARDHGVQRVHLNTNGTFLEGQLVNDIFDAGVESIYIAIDAATAETFNKVRPGGDFNRVKQNVENLLNMRTRHSRKKPEIVVQFIVMGENESEIDGFHAYWLERGAVVKIRLRQGWGLDISAPDLQKAHIERFPCPWLLRTMNVHWNGRVTQCDADYEEKYSAGDINQQSIKEIWNGELALRRERHWAGQFQHPLCNACRDWAAGRAEFYYPDPESKANAPRWSIGENK
jgi:radical SAM protein with 4Fe4S-binding SPASM domain